jgi:ABC-2 type transport system ATP-binding protein
MIQTEIHPDGGDVAGAGILADRLTKRFDDVTAVRELSLTVSPGEIVGLLGRNGSGKTTTVRMLTTLLRPTSGSAVVAGFDIEGSPGEVRRRIGVTFQEAALDPTMSGREHLTLMGRLLGLGHREAGARVEELLAGLGLTDAADRAIGTYSGGMQRRLDIATALLARPLVLFLDEPTTGLDPQSRRVLWDEILALRADGATVLLTTQYMEEADVLADRVLVIEAGSIIASGTPRELRARHGVRTIVLPDDHHVAALVDHVTCGEVRVRDGAAIVEVGLDHSVDRALAEVRAVVGTLDDVTITSATLEDVFIHLTGRDINSGPASEPEPALA